MVRKTFSKTGRSCTVTFTFSGEHGANEVQICGEFNGWSRTPLTRRKDGRFSRTVTLPSGRSYRFRYLVDGQRWENDDAADLYVPNPFGTEDSVIAL
jgi:1,4-alpha-glucan branching enzyme